MTDKKLLRLLDQNPEEGMGQLFGGGTKLSAEDGFLQFMIDRLFASNAPSEEEKDEDQEEAGDDMKLTSLQSITDFMTCAGRTLPAYGLLLVGPAGTGKSQIAYAVARILKLPWTTWASRITIWSVWCRR